MRGCMIRPLSGPATNTIDINALERPRDKRYGGAVRNYNQSCIYYRRVRVMTGLP